jgi:putative hydrolase of HD superfamily
LHRINNRYLDGPDAERRAFADQSERLPDEIKGDVLSLFDEWRTGESREAILARDADLLECLIQAREYQTQGCSSVSDWINNSYSQLQTHTARSLAQSCMEIDPKEWWHGLKVNSGDRP